ncbi:MAG: site-specific DNA-methyltransferase [Lentisphaerae bacterium]|nr:site-specific DNA-methyltransferase [Lentisphaerota bacterium]
MAKSSKKSSNIEVSDYNLQDEYKRTTIFTGECSGISPEDLIGVSAPNVKYSLNNGGADLEKEFAERDPDLDPQYIWRGKQKNDINELETAAPFIYQQEKIFPRMLIEEMKRQTAIRRDAADAQQTFAMLSEDFDPNAKPCYYNHEEGWKNRMILGDSLQVMASLAENERIRGKVQMIYFDPPYGIKFNSNWQPSTKNTNVKDGKKEDITREPEMVKAFRDTWHNGVHSYLGYLRDRFVVARDLLSESGSIFVQIGDANVHKVRAVMEEVFGEVNFVSQITYTSTSGFSSLFISNVTNHILWFAKNSSLCKWRPLFKEKSVEGEGASAYKKIDSNGRRYKFSDLTSQGASSTKQQFQFGGTVYAPKMTSHWKASCPDGMTRLAKAGRITRGEKTLAYIRYLDDFKAFPVTNVWTDTTTGGFNSPKIYVVQTTEAIIQRCMLMCTDPGDLVLDPTCGSGTTATVAEQWGRRWITIDTSRVALALARKRLMTSKYPYYLLADSEAGLKKEMEITGKFIQRPTYNKLSQGFVYERVPHITLKAIANNSEIDTIWEKYEAESLQLREELGIKEEWEVPFEALDEWSKEKKASHQKFVEMRRTRQKEIDDSIARSADTEYLYDKPYEDKKRVRVAGPFTVESIAPVRSLISEANGSLTDPAIKLAHDIDYGNGANYVARMIRALRRSGIKQARKGDKITFSGVEPWGGGKYIAAEAYSEVEDNKKTKRYAIAFGPEFGSVTRLDMRNASREALECGFDALIYCAFNFEAYVEEGGASTFGKIKVMLARMNSDLHMSTDLKDTSSGNPFVIFGEPDIAIEHTEDDLYIVTIRGVDVYDPKKDEVRSDNADAIDCWMLDTDYSGEAFWARQVYFPGKDDAYKAFKTFLKNDIDEEEWESVSKTVSRPFPRPKSGEIAVKVINHFGDEVIKIFKV